MEAVNPTTDAMDYQARVAREREVYDANINVHDLPEIFHVWSHRTVKPKLTALGFDSIDSIWLESVGRASKEGHHCAMASLGAGNCESEVELAKALVAHGMHNFTIQCIDISPVALARGKELAEREGVGAHITVFPTDLNGWKPEPGGYHVVMAFQSLHHFMNLETIFDDVHRALSDDGVFFTNDMIGKNGHQRWPEALTITESLWNLLEPRHKINRHSNQIEEAFVNRDYSEADFEGIRCQDILPLLRQRFHFDVFIPFLNVSQPFIDRVFGHNFRVENSFDREFVEFLSTLDDHAIETGRITPTQMLAVMQKTKLREPKYYKHLTPAFCERDPSAPVHVPKG